MRTRHRDHYTAMAALLETPADAAHERASNGRKPKWTICEPLSHGVCENADDEMALALASCAATTVADAWTHPGRTELAEYRACRRGPTELRRTGCARAGFRGQSAAAVVHRLDRGPRRGRAGLGNCAGTRRTCARGPGTDRPAAPSPTRTTVEVAGPLFAEATELARELGDFRSLAQIIALDWMTGRVLDEPAAAQAAAEEGLRITEDIGDGFLSRQLRYVRGWAQVLRGDLIGCAATLGEVIDESHRGPRSDDRGCRIDHAHIRAGLPGRCCERAGKRR